MWNVFLEKMCCAYGCWFQDWTTHFHVYEVGISERHTSVRKKRVNSYLRHMCGTWSCRLNSTITIAIAMYVIIILCNALCSKSLGISSTTHVAMLTIAT